MLFAISAGDLLHNTSNERQSKDIQLRIIGLVFNIFTYVNCKDKINYRIEEIY